MSQFPLSSGSSPDAGYNSEYSLLQHLPFPVCILRGPDFVVEMANEAVLEIWGLPAHEAIGRSYFEVKPTARELGRQQLFEYICRTGEQVVLEEVPVRFFRAGKPVEQVHKIQHVPLRDEQGSVTGIMAIGMDITEQVHSRKKVEFSEEQLRIALEGGGLGFYDYHPGTTLTTWSDKAKEIFGVSPGPGMSADFFLQLVHPDDQSMVAASLSGAGYCAHIRGVGSEYRIIRPADGQVRWVRTNGKVVRDAAGSILRFIGVVQDITEQKAAEEVLKENEERFRRLSEQAPMWVWMLDREVNVTYANKEMLRYLGLNSLEEFTRKAWEKFTHPDDIELTYKIIGAAVERQEPYTIETRSLNAATGHFEWFLLKGVPVFEKGALSGYVGTGVNIHQQKMFMDRLEQLVVERTKDLLRSNEELQQFAHVASHDLKEPVRKIRTFGNLILKEFEHALPEKAKLYLNKMEAAAARMYSMIEGVLVYASAEATEIRKVPVSLSEIVHSVETDLEVLIQQKGAAISYDRLPVVPGAPVLLHQLFYNLIYNSLKFSRPDAPPRINITARTANGGDLPASLLLASEAPYVVVEVQDNGIGFEPHYEENIFKTFGRLHSREQYEGTGLGLALCKKIAERHGGSIRAEGKPGAGATFLVYLPQRVK